MAVAVNETEVVSAAKRASASTKKRANAFSTLRMAQHQMPVIETTRLGLDRLNEDASRGADLVSRAPHRSQCPRASVIEQCAPPLGE
jgi:hypothetical protein